VKAEAMSSDGSMAIPSPVERKTETELKLMKLMKQRDELLGSRASVERNTKAHTTPTLLILPLLDSSVAR
jgi:hypothetical protein